MNKSRKDREIDNNPKIWIVGLIGLILALGIIILVSFLGSNQQKNKLKEAVNKDFPALIMSMTYDSVGNPIKQEVFDVYKEDIKKAIHNELDGNGGVNKSIQVSYEGALIKKPKITVNQFTMEINDIGPDLIIVVNDKEVKHGNDNKIKVTAIPGKNVVRFIMNADYYKDTGAIAEVNFSDGLTQAEINSGYGFKNFTVNVNKDAMLTINNREVMELKSGKNTVLLPTNLDLNIGATDRVNLNVKSEQVKITKDLENIDLTLKNTVETKTTTRAE